MRDSPLRRSPIPRTEGVIIQQEFESPTLPHIVEQISRALPTKMHAERGIMMRTMLIYTCAGFERDSRPRDSVTLAGLVPRPPTD